MNKYFFDFSDGIDVWDEVGQELPGLEAARRAALQRATEYVANLDNGAQGGHILINICDANRGAFLSLRMVCQIVTAQVDSVRVGQHLIFRGAAFTIHA